MCSDSGTQHGVLMYPKHRTKIKPCYESMIQLKSCKIAYHCWASPFGNLRWEKSSCNICKFDVFARLTLFLLQASARCANGPHRNHERSIFAGLLHERLLDWREDCEDCTYSVSDIRRVLERCFSPKHEISSSIVLRSSGKKKGQNWTPTVKRNHLVYKHLSLYFCIRLS